METKLYRSIHVFMLENTFFFCTSQESVIKRLLLVFVLFVFCIFSTGLIKITIFVPLKENPKC